MTFTFSTVVPYNQPVAALDLLNRFLRNETFLDVPAPTIRFGERGVSSAMDMANPLEPLAQHGNHRMTTPVIASLAFLAGILFTVIINKFMESRRRNNGGYSRIPEATKTTTNGEYLYEATSSEASNS